MSATPDKQTQRKGKFARLPYETREQLCRYMRDGWTGKKLFAWLATAAADHGPFNDVNLTNWRQGGYKDWLKEQDKLDAIRSKSETIRRELEAGGFSVLDKSIYDLAEKISDSIADPAKAAAAIATLKNAVTLAERTKISALRATIAQETANVYREKFQRDTCVLFRKWYADENVRAIMSDPEATDDQRTERLGQRMFGEDWK